jgi:phosphopentomutase
VRVVTGHAAGRCAFVLVLDACGVGELPDADAYGDAGTNTLAHLAEAAGGLRLPTLARLGLGSIVRLAGVAPSANPAIHGRLHPLGPGKDSIAGHWELMGVVSERRLPTYPDGLPPQLIDELAEVLGRALICNRARNGLAAIDEFGAEHLRSGALILYTSQDSVVQLAAHVDLLDEAALYAACEAVRRVLRDQHAVGRVIARPFRGRPGEFTRTPGRRDFTLRPPRRSYLQVLQEAGVDVHAVGKISDLFAGVGITCAHLGTTNAQALTSTEALLDELGEGLVFVNLIETDQSFGHRKDVCGFVQALAEFDDWLAGALARLRLGDLMIVTADHGVDPAHPGTDHTREYAPLLAVTGQMLNAGVADLRGGASAVGAPTREHSSEMRHDGPLADVGATVLRWLCGRDAPTLPGRPFLEARAVARS